MSVLPQPEPSGMQGQPHRRPAERARQGQHGGIRTDDQIQGGDEGGDAGLIVTAVEPRR